MRITYISSHDLMFAVNNMSSMLQLILCGLLVLPSLVSSEGARTVQTTFGPVLGAVFTVPGVSGEGVMFRGLHYAAPPTGERRFAPPEEPEPWTSVYDAAEFSPVCPQNRNAGGDLLQFFKFNISAVNSFDMSEDCLTLDVYTPALEGSRTVMVFIHGGALTSGFSRYEGRDLALSHDVVAVYIQYRLGVLGWASTGDGVIQGNMGFMDQILALKWVQNNIAKFGGNPDEVTIYGISAGGWSVSLHIISPKSKGLFKRAILMSGSKIGGSGMSPPVDMAGQTRILAGNLGCGNESSTGALLRCLQEIQDPDIIVRGSLYFNAVPVVDGDFIPRNPTELMQQGNFNDVDTMAGVMANEGFLFLVLFANFAVSSEFDVAGFEKLIQIIIPFEYPNVVKNSKLMEILTKLLIQEYAKDLQGDELRVAAAEMLGDMLITKQTYKTMKYMEAKSSKNLYFYEWYYRPSLMLRPDYMFVDHADEAYMMGSTKTGLLLGIPYDGFTQEDKKMDNIMLSYWANFAKTGNPNGGDNPNWPSFREKGAYMKLNLSPSVDKDFKPSRMKFWMETFPHALQQTDTASINFPSSSALLMLSCLTMCFQKFF